MLFAEGGEGVGGTVVSEGAAGLKIREHNRLLRAEDLGGLRHEVDTAEGDHIGIGAGGFAGQLE